MREAFGSIERESANKADAISDAGWKPAVQRAASMDRGLPARTRANGAHKLPFPIQIARTASTILHDASVSHVDCGTNAQTVIIR